MVIVNTKKINSNNQGQTMVENSFVMNIDLFIIKKKTTFGTKMQEMINIHRDVFDATITYKANTE